MFGRDDRNCFPCNIKIPEDGEQLLPFTKHNIQQLKKVVNGEIKSGFDYNGYHQELEFWEGILEIILRTKLKKDGTLPKALDLPFALNMKVHSPYDGCFWEWNYVLAQFQCGEWILSPLFLTQQTWGKEREMKLSTFLVDHIIKSQEYNSYPPFELPSIVELADLHKEDCHYWGSFWEHIVDEEQLDWKWLCPMCERMTAEQPMMTGYQGDGGIGIIATDVVCSECYCNNSCSYCGEFMDPYNKFYPPLCGEDGTYCCAHCAEKCDEEMLTCDRCGEHKFLRGGHGEAEDYVTTDIVDRDNEEPVWEQKTLCGDCYNTMFECRVCGRMTPCLEKICAACWDKSIGREVDTGLFAGVPVRNLERHEQKAFDDIIKPEDETK